MLAWLFWYLENCWTLCSDAISHVSVHVVFLVCLKFSVCSITCVSQPLRVHVLKFGSSLYSTCAQIPELAGILPWRGYRGWSCSINICSCNLLSCAQAQLAASRRLPAPAVGLFGCSAPVQRCFVPWLVSVDEFWVGNPIFVVLGVTTVEIWYLNPTGLAKKD